MTEPTPFSKASKQGREARPASSVFQSIVRHMQEILRSEVQLARAEIREEIREARRAGTYMLVAGATGVFGVGFLLLGVVYGLSNAIPAWAAAAAVGLLLVVIAGVCFSVGRQKLSEIHAKPEKTVDSVKENVTWIRKRAG